MVLRERSPAGLEHKWQAVGQRFSANGRWERRTHQARGEPDRLQQREWLMSPMGWKADVSD
jgi:hypothetical protein